MEVGETATMYDFVTISDNEEVGNTGRGIRNNKVSKSFCTQTNTNTHVEEIKTINVRKFYVV